ncbi:MAG: malto-oligosyltrehalose trehalohydrolase [Myxococcaceae bacterium]
MVHYEPRLGANVDGDGTTTFRVWAPDRRRVEVIVEYAGEQVGATLHSEADGHFSGQVQAPPGARYRYRLDGGDAFPDPCSRFQPEGPHGPSEVIDFRAFDWTETNWTGVSMRDAVFYELHVGTFTPEGTYAGVRRKLPWLRDLGVNVLELMPLNTFPGRFNWGYDGTHPFAPCAVYGDPDELRKLVDDAHAQGIAVILDVVYNHFGPDGTWLAQFAKHYFTKRHSTEWGDPVNFDGEGSGPVRTFFIENIRHWIAEYRLDGMRLDATQTIFDATRPHVLAELTTAAREVTGERTLLLLAENEPQSRTLLLPTGQGGSGCDAMWIDDFHHSTRVAATLRSEAYTADYRGTASELLSCVRFGSLYAGQWYAWQQKPRGTPLHEFPPERLVFFLQNHDQVANLAMGDRLHVFGEPRVRALTVFWLLLPYSPLLFMGQEFFASTPFLYFVDHKPELQERVREGRRKFVAQFPSTRHALDKEGVDPDIGEVAFQRSRLDWSDAERNEKALTLHRELLRLRREDPVFASRTRPEGATLSEEALVLRWFGEGERLLLLNLGPDLTWDPCPQPLLAPPAGGAWRPLISSKEVRFGGHGAVFPDGTGRWQIPGQCALVLTSQGSEEP